MSVDADAARAQERDPALSARARVTTKGLVRGVPRAAVLALYTLLALAIAMWAYIWLRWSLANDVVGFDFRGTLWDSGIAIREGRSPTAITSRK